MLILYIKKSESSKILLRWQILNIEGSILEIKRKKWKYLEVSAGLYAEDEYNILTFSEGTVKLLLTANRCIPGEKE